ncbi:centrosomal protein CCDC61 isoform X3 [Caloenas nicobarica]|uniref:centrosomal protein CCDC61 isoform X3 n=1 Tax=Caloenas nicobarica TaxID=187106 RepID=UPI0032B72178
MEEPRSLQADCAFRHGGHSVRLTLTPATLTVAVEAHGTGDRWRGQFDAAFIEDLTHKTGNFKQFGVFCHMLELALTQGSESVSLELLSFSDLQTLRSRKMGGDARPPPQSPSLLRAKRYLILIYSVEFDRIHYPLPLPYVGGPDRDHRDPQIRRLQDELRRAREELRAALRRLEEERARHRRLHRRLEAELAEAKASERRLQQRLQRLTAELGACRRGRRTPTGSERRSHSGTRPAPRSPAPAAARDGESGEKEKKRIIATSTGPKGVPAVPGLTARLQKVPAWLAKTCQRSGGRPAVLRPIPFFGPAIRGDTQGFVPSLTPALSPPGPRPPRFDPTAFVRSRQRRQQELDLKNRRHRAAFGSTSPARSRGRSSSAESVRSRRSVLSSGSAATEPPQPRGRSVTRRPLSASSCNGAATHPSPPSGATSKRPGKENRDEEPLAEIDARLRALQEYMERLGTR